jgi:DNA-binding winged helix-turn-helix (wHTH) protein
MRVRLVIAFALMSAVAVFSAALLTLRFDYQRADREAERRLETAASFTLTMLMAERDRNRINAQEIASRTTVQQLVLARDSAGLSRLLAGLRQVVRDDILAVYAADGTCLASDAMPELQVDGPMGLVSGALAGTANVATMNQGGHILTTAAAPISYNNETIGAVLAGDLLDERFARRMSNAANLTVALTTEAGLTIATEPLRGPLLTPEHWGALRARGDVWLHAPATAFPLKALARPLMGSDNRPVGAMVLGMPENSIVPIERQDFLLYLGANGLLLLALWSVSIVAAWGFTRRQVGGSGHGQPVEGLVAPSSHGAVATALLGRGATNGPDPSAERRYFNDLVIDRARRRVLIGEREVTLTPTEFDLLWTLAAAPGHVVSRDELLAALRGSDWQAEPGMLDTHVSNLRRKIEPDPTHPHYVLTVRGVGYKLQDEDVVHD